jgi:hypothetical protein
MQTSVGLRPLSAAPPPTPPAPPPRPSASPAPVTSPDLLTPHLAQLGFHAFRSGDTEYIVPPVCDVPAGPFLMGSNPKRDRDAYEGEMPQHSVTLATFQIGKYPVTVAEYTCFVRAGQGQPYSWQQQLSKLDHPVRDVSWPTNCATRLLVSAAHPGRAGERHVDVRSSPVAMATRRWNADGGGPAARCWRITSAHASELSTEVSTSRS